MTVLFFYLLIGFISSRIYHFSGLVDILIWPITIPLKLFFKKHNDTRGE